jgi:hypothetical protein
MSTLPIPFSRTSRLWCPGVWPGVLMMTTVPSPKTSLSPTSASSFPPPLIQRAKGTTFAPTLGAHHAPEGGPPSPHPDHPTSPLSGFPAGPLAPLLPTRRWPPCMRRRTGTGTQLFSLQVRLHLRCNRANGTDSGDKLRFRAPEFRRPIADLLVFAHVDASGICRDLLRLVVCHTYSFVVGLAVRSPCDARSDCGLRRCRPSPS